MLENFQHLFSLWSKGIETPDDGIQNKYAKKILFEWVNGNNSEDAEELYLAFLTPKKVYLEFIDKADLQGLFSHKANVESLLENFGVVFENVSSLKKLLKTMEVYELYAFLIFTESYTLPNLSSPESNIWDVILFTKKEDEDY